MEKINVELGDRSYTITVGEGCRYGIFAAIGDAPTLLVVDSTVAELYGDEVRNAVRPRETFVVQSGESSKTPETAVAICRAAARAGLDRHCRFVALGGGVTGDLTGFAAAIYMRGVRFVQMPTTLLAMVDSSVGGKTGADIPEGKNLVGAFHQPDAVLADTGFLATLPARRIADGLAETIKIAAILDLEFFDWLYERRNHLTDVSDHALYSEMICRACALKSGIVAADEREAGCRALLNYGHTFGHALEIAGDFSISHGEAVACGMTAAAAFAEAHGDLAHGEVVRQTELLTAAGLPTVSPRQFGAERLLELMGRDKKNSGGGINIVVPVGLGKGVVLRHADRAGLVEALEAINA